MSLRIIFKCLGFSQKISLNMLITTTPFIWRETNVPKPEEATFRLRLQRLPIPSSPSPMSRRVRNGRSPLVSKQSQITAFFPSPKTPKSSQTLTPNSPTPATSSRSPHPPDCSRSRSEVGKKIRVFWPLDGKWYDGRVASFDEAGGKHTVKYDDGDVEDLDLKSEKIEWVEETPVSLQRLNRRVSLGDGDSTVEEEKTPVGFRRMSPLGGGDDSAVEKEETPVSFRRLRRMSSLGYGDDSPVEKEKRPVSFLRLRKVSLGDSGGDSTMEEVDASPISVRRPKLRVSVCGDGDGDGDDDDNSVQDEDWGKEISDDDDDDDDDESEMEIELEEEDEFGGGKKMKNRGSSMKRRKCEVEKVDSSVKKKARVDGSGGKMFSLPTTLNKKTPKCEAVGNIVRGDGGKVTFSSPLAPVTTTRKSLEHACIVDNISVLHGDAAERFGKRETEKFRFLHERRKDANGRHPGDVNYDPKTIFLPQEFLKSLSGGQRQWWGFKSKHMDKVLFFKMGKFYELFEMDAHVGAKELDLQYMKGEQPHCGFPEKNFSMNLEKLARKGYRVLVIEQTETPNQLELRRKEMGSKDKVVKREICAVVTKGTLTEGELLSTNPDASYLMSLTEGCLDNHEGIIVVGVCVVDVSTNKFMLGQFEDDSERQCLCSLLSELRPVEIIKPLKTLSTETEKVLQKHTRNPLFNDLIPITEFWNAEKTVSEVRNAYQLMGKDIKQLPDVLSGLISDVENGKYALSAFGGCIFYLRQSLLDESLLRCAKFESLPCSNFCTALEKEIKEYMILDAAALESLEILENNRNGSQSGTLFAQLNHCVTAFGKRLLKSWLVRPLYDKGLIVERQDAVAGLKVSTLASALEFRKDISRLPDMERLLARLFSSYEASGRNASKVVLYEDASKKQLREFTAALRGCESMVKACSSFRNILNDNNSTLLHRLLTPGKGFPDILSNLKYFKDAFDWSDADQTGRIIPHVGADLEYDSVCKTVKEIRLNLKNYLEEQRRLLKDTSINYVTIGKDSYLLELPEQLKSKIPRDYELQSSKKGYFRYWTAKIKMLLAEHTQAEAEKETILKSILHRLIGRFSEHHSEWRQLVSTVAEIDVLISVAIARDYYEGPTCRPTITAASYSHEVTPSLFAKSLGHPLLHSDTLGKGSFVPNDVSIGGVGHASFILLTGPNMGGKSTLLRQICLAVILAQIGADVPAESFELSPVDRIFVRMGAKDHIMAGQSTFLTELLETASMLSCATHKSLVALDELGRGTSTSDGQAIAESVLEYFIHTVGCRGMFSTHYHRLALEYERNPKVSLCHMACQVGKGVDGVEEVTFLYRLIGGSCPKSYGVNVARLAGLPASVLKKSIAKSRQFEAVYGNEIHSAPDMKSLNIIGNDGVALVKDIFCIAFTTIDGDGDEKNECTVFTWLSALQQRAKLLIEQV